MLTVEGGAVLGGKLENVDYLAKCGVKIMTLTWNGNCELGDGIGVEGAKGLTDFGKSVVAKMEQNSIAVDVSHSSVQCSMMLQSFQQGHFVRHTQIQSKFVRIEEILQMSNSLL